MLGQFLTPSLIADFMASLLEIKGQTLNLLDAGSGEGALTAALIRNLVNRQNRPTKISVTAYEIDPSMIAPLRATLTGCKRQCEAAGIQFSFNTINEDFILAATEMVRGGLFAAPPQQFTAAIVNPPYKKIRSNSSTRKLLSGAGIETSNLYTAFVGLISKLLVKGGELVAITPRSYCNGPYFRRFRSEFLNMMSLRRLHVFESRSAAFREDEVLQENVIVHAIRGVTKPRRIVISTSSGCPGAALAEQTVPYEQVVLPGDLEQFIHLPTDDGHVATFMGKLTHSLRDLGISVSTGRVVDFRSKSFLRSEPARDIAPLIYPCHFNDGLVRWPNENARKPNAILVNARTKELLVRAGIYVLVKRFSSKEERRRIVACIYDPEIIPARLVGFENHLNYFHASSSGLTMTLAKGLMAFLNSTVVDQYFRQFSGHTQVNATDLRKLGYPTRIELEKIGHGLKHVDWGQEELDHVVGRNLL